MGQHPWKLNDKLKRRPLLRAPAEVNTLLSRFHVSPCISPSLALFRFFFFYPRRPPASQSLQIRSGDFVSLSLFISLLSASQPLPCNPSCFSVSVCVFDCLWLILILGMWPRKLFIKHILSHVSKAVWVLFNSNVLHSRLYRNSYDNASFLIVCEIAYCNYWHVSYIWIKYTSCICSVSCSKNISMFPLFCFVCTSTFITHRWIHPQRPRVSFIILPSAQITHAGKIKIFFMRPRIFENKPANPGVFTQLT